MERVARVVRHYRLSRPIRITDEVRARAACIACMHRRTLSGRSQHTLCPSRPEHQEERGEPGCMMSEDPDDAVTAYDGGVVGARGNACAGDQWQPGRPPARPAITSEASGRRSP